MIRRAGGALGAGAGSLRRLVLALGLALALLAALPGGSALAAVAGHEIVGVPSAVNSSNKTVTASCPAGKQVVGAGGNKSLSAGGQVLVSRIRPDSGLQSVTVSGVEDETGFAGTWGLSAYAFCATPPPGLVRVPATSATSSANKSVTASCPAGKKLLGTGGEITGGAGQVVLGAIRPLSDLSGVVVTGGEDGNGYAGSWNVTAYAVCATPPSGLVRVAATSPTNSSDKTIQANCSGGKRPLGVGGQVNNGAGQVSMDLSPFTVGDDFVGANARAFEDESGFAGNWSVTAYAICAAVSRRVVEQTATDSNDGKTAQLLCPGGLQETGVGGDISGGAGQVLLDDVTPLFSPPTAADVVGFEDETGFAGNWFARAYGICATPHPGLERVAASSGFGSQPAASASLFCPAGKKVVGVGGDITGGQGQVVLSAILPGSTLADATATGYEDPTGYSGNWEVAVYAICATPPPGLQLVSVESPFEFDADSATATCPAGKNLLGGGAYLFNAQGRVVLDDMRPDALLRSLTATGMVGENGISNSWSVTAYAICANP